MLFMVGILRVDSHVMKHTMNILGGIHSLYGLLHQIQIQRSHKLRQHTGGSSFVLVVTSSTK